MAEVILCRHGYTPANADMWDENFVIRDAIYYDELCPLDRRYGVKQAEELGEFLSENYSDKKILLCYSPHYRTRETKSRVYGHLSKNNDVTTLCVPAIREINQGLNYAKLRSMFAEDDYEAQDFYDKRKTANKIAISYLQGESELDVRRRVRHFASKLREYQETSMFDGEDYDLVVAITHSTTIKGIYYGMYRKPTGIKMPTAGAIKAGEMPELIFKPKTQAPENYMTDLNKYNDYFRLRIFYNHIDKLKSDLKFHAFFGNHIYMPIVDDTQTIEKSGESVTSLPINTDKKGLYLVDSVFGRDAYTYDKKSTSIYWVLEGSGEFEIEGKILAVKAGDIVKIPPNTTFYYKGKMRLIEKVEPNIQSENVVVVRPVGYDKKAEFNYIPSNVPVACEDHTNSL